MASTWKRDGTLDGRSYPILGAVEDGEWVDIAPCRGHTELFFGPDGERPERRAAREKIAKSFCAHCTVADACREAGRRNRENGIWGGENDEERALAGYAPRAVHRGTVAAARREGLRRLRVVGNG